MTPSIRRGFIDTGRCLSGSLIFHLDALENYLYSDHPLLYSSFMTSEMFIVMRRTIALKFALEEEDCVVYDIYDAARSHDSMSFLNVIEQIGDSTTSITTLLGGYGYFSM